MERTGASVIRGVVALVLLASVALGAGTQAQEGTPEAAVDPVNVAHPAHVHSGSCDSLGEVVEPLSDLTEQLGDPVGAAGGIPVSRSYTEVPLSLDDLLAGDYSINVHLSAQDIDTYVACGEIGGRLEVNGALTIGLSEQAGSGRTGIAYLSAGASEGTTGILLFMTDGDAGAAGGAATPVGGGVAIEVATSAPEETPEPTEESTEETVEVSLTEWAISMPSTLEAGTVIFEVINDGTVPHTFTIASDTMTASLDAPIGPGETGRLTVDLTPGAYVVFCPIGDGAHREIGMQLDITVE